MSVHVQKVWQHNVANNETNLFLEEGKQQYNENDS